MAAEIEVVGRKLSLEEAAPLYRQWIATCDWGLKPSLLWFWAYAESGSDIEEHGRTSAKELSRPTATSLFATKKGKLFMKTPHTRTRR